MCACVWVCVRVCVRQHRLQNRHLLWTLSATQEESSDSADGGLWAPLHATHSHTLTHRNTQTDTDPHTHTDTHTDTVFSEKSSLLSLLTEHHCASHSLRHKHAFVF